MEKNKEIIVPTCFSHSLFFSTKDRILKIDSSQTIKAIIKNNPFAFDIAEVELPSSHLPKPWLRPKEAVPILLELWDENRGDLLGFYKERNATAAREPMIQSIGYFFELLFWMNQTHITGLKDWQNQVNKLPTKPINVIERLQFILLKPANYHSFIQLSELFNEANKQFLIGLSLSRTNSTR